jgi:hypothetical protein
MNTFGKFSIGAVFAAAAFAAGAQTDEPPMRDPWVPPALRSKAATQPPAAGDALKAQVERKLRASFDAADVSGKGLTREQAEAAGLGYVAKNFDRIDTAGTGRVTFDDLTRYLRARGANL